MLTQLSPNEYKQTKIIGSRDGNKTATIMHKQTTPPPTKKKNKKKKKGDKKDGQTSVTQSNIQASISSSVSSGGQQHHIHHHFHHILSQNSDGGNVFKEGSGLQNIVSATSAALEDVFKNKCDQKCKTLNDSKSKPDIWYKSDEQERQRIREFWLQLSEQDRKNLVVLEKEAVLKKIKEQQKHSCSCHVCGRKRSVIEEELELLYDAYYEELENFATDTHKQHPHSLISNRSKLYENLHKKHSFVSEYKSVDSSDECDSVLEFGTSLTVKGGILTVADDFLKNDGKKFLDLMEQLTEHKMRQMQPESESEEDESEEEESEESEYYDEDDDDLTEEQRMEEGRRMFQIFAAKMFEQRVLTAYREKVAKDRSDQLLIELEEEELRKKQQEELKQKQKEEKKAKKRQLKQAKEEERLAKEAEKRAIQEERNRQEKAKRDLERAKTEAEKKKKEEERLQKLKQEEEERKLMEKLKKEKEEKKKRRQEQLELKKQELLKLEKEREEKERIEREKREKEEHERREKEKREREEREKREREERERLEKERLELFTQQQQQQQQVKLPPGIPSPVSPIQNTNIPPQIRTPINNPINQINIPMHNHIIPLNNPINHIHPLNNPISPILNPPPVNPNPMLYNSYMPNYNIPPPPALPLPQHFNIAAIDPSIIQLKPFKKPAPIQRPKPTIYDEDYPDVTKILLEDDLSFNWNQNKEINKATFGNIW